MKKHCILAALAASVMSAPAHAVTSIEDKLAVLQEEIEHIKLQMERSDKNRAGGIQAFADRTALGGYGELHYNNFSGGATDKDMIDFHRFVLFLGHRFNDWISLKAELEVEHALSKDTADASNKGAVELEQAYLDFNINKHFNAKAGVFLLPLGMLNETHEPPTFYGVERNEIETRVIPSTWWEAGVGAYGEITPGLNYQLNITSSPDIGKLTNFSKGFRDARRSVSEAPAENYGVSGALNYTGVPGLLVGWAFFSGNTGQDGASRTGLNGVDARLTVWDVHTRYSTGRLDMRALYARGYLGDAAEINRALGKAANSSSGVGESFYGWYAEAAYHIWKQGDHDLAPFVRYEKWDMHDEVPAGYVQNAAYSNSIWTFGANYWPQQRVVLKADYQRFGEADGTKGDKRINMGMGYMF